MAGVGYVHYGEPGCRPSADGFEQGVRKIEIQRIHERIGGEQEDKAPAQQDDDAAFLHGERVRRLRPERFPQQDAAENEGRSRSEKAESVYPLLGPDQENREWSEHEQTAKRQG